VPTTITTIIPSRLSTSTLIYLLPKFKKNPEAVLAGTHSLTTVIDLTCLGPMLQAYPDISPNSASNPISFLGLSG